MRIEFPFIGGAYTSRSSSLDAQVCQNLFPITDQYGGKSVMALMGTPGSKLWCSLGISGEVRGMIPWKDYLYAVIGSTLIKINSDGMVSAIIGTLSTAAGRVWMVGGFSQLFLVDALYGYYYTESTTTFTRITDLDFPAASSGFYLDGYFYVTRKDSDEFYISAAEDASAWAGLDFASAEDTPDDVLAGTKFRREAWMFGETTTEIFNNSGNATYPLTRVSGGVLPFGCGAANSIASGPEGLFWLDNHFQVRQAQGYNAVVISTDHIEYAFSTYQNKHKAIGYTYTQEGHSFYVLNIANATWVFDVTTGLWHTRSSGTMGGRHFGNCSAFFAGKVLAGHHSNGNIYELDLGTYTDAGDTIIAVRACQPIQKNRNLIFIGSLELAFETGVGLSTGQGSDPMAMLDLSTDGGKTWSNEYWASIGAIGRYDTRVIWRRLGRGREFIFRVKISDPIKRVITGAFLEGTFA